MIREPYIGMPIFIGGTQGNHPVQNFPSRPSQQPESETGSAMGTGFDARLLGSLPLAMAYVPMQQWKTTYSPEKALMRGTIFPELDLPFEGRTI